MRRKQEDADRLAARLDGEGLGAQPDRALLATARSDPDAFAELYRRLVDRVVSFAARRISDPPGRERNHPVDQTPVELSEGIGV